MVPFGRHTLIVFHHVAEVVAAGVMRLAHAHRVVREVHIAVVAYCGVQESAGWSEIPGWLSWSSISKAPYIDRIAAFGLESRIMHMRGCESWGVD